MRNDYQVIDAPYGDHYDVSWMVEHPLVVGFMERPVDGDWVATCRMFGSPYRENIITQFDRLASLGATEIAVYSGRTVTDSTGSILFLRYDAK